MPITRHTLYTQLRIKKHQKSPYRNLLQGKRESQTRLCFETFVGDVRTKGLKYLSKRGINKS